MFGRGFSGTCDAGHENCDLACLGCGRCDSMGVHYRDCTLLETGDWVVERTSPPPTEADAVLYEG